MEREHLKQIYRGLYTDIEEILFRLDPMGINLGNNNDEYNPEVHTILPRLKETNSEADVHNIVYEEFVRWFGADSAGSRDSQSYKEAAKEIWAAWEKFKTK